MSEFAGDKAATFEKARELLAEASRDARGIGSVETVKQRRRVREIAHTAWLAVTTAADALLIKRRGAPADKYAEVRSVYDGLPSKARGGFGVAYSVLHVSCGYNDSQTACARPSVEAAIRSAAEAIRGAEQSSRSRRKRAKR